MTDVQNAAVSQPRLLMVLLVTLSGAAFFLAAIGIHGLIASSVAERTREMGIRLALGASRRDAIRTLAAPGILLAILGTVIGGVAARGAVNALQAFLWGVSPADPLTFFGVAALFVMVATIASVVPALRILSLDPARTLRTE